MKFDEAFDLFSGVTDWTVIVDNRLDDGVWYMFPYGLPTNHDLHEFKGNLENLPVIVVGSEEKKEEVATEIDRKFGDE